MVKTMLRRLYLSVIVFTLSPIIAFSSSVPDELQYILRPDSRYDNGYKEERFHWVLDQVYSVASEWVRSRGGELRFERDWTDGAVNMWAGRTGNEYWVEIPGGFPKFYLINEEAFLLTVCHELGHLLGGEPMQHDISFEGQADYWSTKFCAPRALQLIAPEKQLPENSEIVDKCKSYPNAEICFRTLAGALSVTSYFAEVLSVPAPQLSTPDMGRVKETLPSHPQPQCRLDTLVAGTFNLARPACWYYSKFFHMPSYNQPLNRR